MFLEASAATFSTDRGFGATAETDHRRLPQELGKNNSGLDTTKSAEQEEEEEEVRVVTSEAHGSGSYHAYAIHGADTRRHAAAEEAATEMVSSYRVFVPRPTVSPRNHAPIAGFRCSGHLTERYDIHIKHRVLTSIARVGLQVWRGAFLLADYILHHSAHLRSKTVFELGCGTGILGVVLTLCGHPGPIFLTDYSSEIVSLCNRNISDNTKIQPFGESVCTRDSGGGSSVYCSGDNVLVRSRVLDWLSDWNPRGKLPPNTPNNALSEVSLIWNADDVNILGSAAVDVQWIAADVIYDDELTKYFFKKASELMKPGECMWLSLEKRYNFCIDERDIVANGYKLFVEHVNVCSKRPGGEAHPRFVYDTPFCPARKVFFEGKKVPIDFPQRIFDYDRIQDLELWEIKLITLFD